MASAGTGSDGAAAAASDAGKKVRERPWEYSLRKYLLLLATLVATVTYTAPFAPPGGVWEEKDPGGQYLAGDPILQHKSLTRYAVFFYSNATAFASSLVVIVLILILSLRHEMRCRSLAPVGVLRGFMVLDLLSLMAAYTAGIYRARDVPVYPMVLAALTIVYVILFHMVLPQRCSPPRELEDGKKKKKTPGGELEDGRSKTFDELEKERKERERPRKVLMLLATFAVSVTYLAGLSAPGGFQDDGDLAGEPVLMEGRHVMRFKAFVHLNSTAFFWSLLITVQLLDKNLRMPKLGKPQPFRSILLHASIVFALLGLVGAYATGGSRDTNTTIFVALLGAAVPAGMLLIQWILYNQEGSAPTPVASAPAPAPTPEGGEEVDKARSLVMLLATLAATITYQAGLDPPGGLWDNDGIGYKAGDPILRTINPKRYNAFFYCNSVAFVASLLAIILVQNNLLVKTHALLAAMILDLFGLIGAYAAGSCRDVSTSIYAMALAGAVLVYVVIHIVFFTLDHDTVGSDDDEVVEKRRKRLMLFAILAATITYQAGLTPPGGFFLQNDNNYGHRAGDPVLLHNSKRRYTSFFYCNSVSFMLSIAMIILLINKNLYRSAIRSHAIAVCTAAGMLSLVGAYATGSTQNMRTSIKIFGLAAAILIAVVAVVLIFVGHSPEDDVPKMPIEEKSVEDKDEKKLHSKRKYLMLLGILAASVTYQAGLKPPGGVWEDNDDLLGHVAGNPIMRDNGRPRYLAFFYINSISFVASIVAIILLLLRPPHKDKVALFLKAMNITIILDLLGLLLAYAVGSARSWRIIGYVFVLVFMVLAYITIHVSLAYLITSGFFKEIFKRETKDMTLNSHSNQEV